MAKPVAGPGVYIRDECVDLGDMIIAEEPAPVRWERFSGADRPDTRYGGMATGCMIHLAGFGAWSCAGRC
ncbi:MAG: hypothetical protein ACQSGP_25795 [Frankia sp.]